MDKQTVQGLMLERLTKIEIMLDGVRIDISSLKVKATIAGGIAGLIGTGVMALIVNLWK